MLGILLILDEIIGITLMQIIASPSIFSRIPLFLSECFENLLLMVLW